MPILFLFATALFVGAALLFTVEPMMGKMILPLLGGTPAVWSTCLVFFQTALLAGYAYAHLIAARLRFPAQAALHLLVLLLPLVALPLSIDPALARGAHPALDVLVLLSASVGLPFLVVSATAPLLQRWFAHTRHPAARDPYFLYAASNLGSMLALLSYPALVEPRLSLRGAGGLTQTRMWAAGYALLVALTALCALAAWRLGRRTPEAEAESEAVAASDGAPSAWRRVRWVLLTLVPSSLLLGTTGYLTTDVAAVPLFWVLPLAVYLLSFILAFGAWPPRVHRVVAGVAPVVALATLFLMLSRLRLLVWANMLWHLGLLLVVSLACHGEVARDRPAAHRLTGFYLLVALGGVLGGLFNAIVAPVVFSSLVEYPLAMIAACALLAGRSGPAPPWPIRRVVAAVALVAGLALVLYSESLTLRVHFAFLSRLVGGFPARVTEWFDTLDDGLDKAFEYLPPLVAAFALFRRRPWALGTALAAVIAVSGFVDARTSDQVLVRRSFFGVLRVTRDTDAKGYVDLRHGTTLHGRQSLDPERRGSPLSYYHRKGPVGRLFDEMERRHTVLRTAVIGLGAGTVAAYARPGDQMTFYEIDRLVRDIALDPKYFTYVSDAETRGALVRLELGDARVRLDAVRRERPGERYDLIVVDAFTSDAIPVHLVTREALRLYLSVLAPDGIVAFHVSNRYLRLDPVVARLAADAGLEGRLLGTDDSPDEDGAARSTWVVLAQTPGALGALAGSPGWTPLDPPAGTVAWTDDFHDLLGVFKWR